MTHMTRKGFFATFLAAFGIGAAAPRSRTGWPASALRYFAPPPKDPMLVLQEYVNRKHMMRVFNQMSAFRDSWPKRAPMSVREYRLPFRIEQ